MLELLLFKRSEVPVIA